MRRVALWGLMISIGALVGFALPDLRRYVRISTM
jgi:hypothetical protein